MKLRCWGTRGNLATPREEMLGLGGNTSCYEVRLDRDSSLILDCGTGLIEYADSVMARASQTPTAFHMIVSHFHWDHLLGLPFFHPIHLPDTTLHLYSAFPRANLERHIRALFDGTYSPLRDIDNLKASINFHEIPAAGLEIAGARVRLCPVHHTEPCFAVRIEHGASSLAYVTDHEAGPSDTNRCVVDFAQGVDLLLHDAQFTREEYAIRAGWGHSSIEAALENGRQAGVKQLLLTHHDPAHTDTFLREYLATHLSATEVPRVSLAAEGGEIDV